jgi:hypothetical protein
LFANLSLQRKVIYVILAALFLGLGIYGVTGYVFAFSPQSRYIRCVELAEKKAQEEGVPITVPGRIRMSFKCN